MKMKQTHVCYVIFQNFYSFFSSFEISAVAAPLVHNVRCMAGDHHVPAHWKPIKDICMENRNHMDFMPVPEGSWQDNYSKRQRTYNLFLLSGAIACGVTYFIVS